MDETSEILMLAAHILETGKRDPVTAAGAIEWAARHREHGSMSGEAAHACRHLMTFLHETWLGPVFDQEVRDCLLCQLCPVHRGAEAWADPEQTPCACDPCALHDELSPVYPWSVEFEQLDHADDVTSFEREHGREMTTRQIRRAAAPREQWAVTGALPGPEATPNAPGYFPVRVSLSGLVGDVPALESFGAGRASHLWVDPTVLDAIARAFNNAAYWAAGPSTTIVLDGGVARLKYWEGRKQTGAMPGAPERTLEIWPHTVHGAGEQLYPLKAMTWPGASWTRA